MIVAHRARRRASNPNIRMKWVISSILISDKIISIYNIYLLIEFRLCLIYS